MTHELTVASFPSFFYRHDKSNPSGDIVVVTLLHCLIHSSKFGPYTLSHFKRTCSLHPSRPSFSNTWHASCLQNIPRVRSTFRWKLPGTEVVVHAGSLGSILRDKSYSVSSSIIKVLSIRYCVTWTRKQYIT